MNRKLVIGMIMQAITDLGLKEHIRYQDDIDHCLYGADEAKRWLETYGVAWMVWLGIPINCVRIGLTNPAKLIEDMELLRRGLDK